MTRAMTDLAIGGFGDLWLYSGKEDRQKLRVRDRREAVVAAHACEQCGAEKGVACHRVSVAGVITKGQPHFGRAKSGRYAPRRREGY